MEEYNLNPAEEDLDAEAPETPEDVAVLYTWANVHGGKYRDFSASRREFRAQQRHRLVERQRQAELDAAQARQEAAAQEMEQVRRLEEEAQQDDRLRAEADEARRRAEENAEQERMAAQRHVEVAEELKRALEEAQREMEAARRRAEEQAARYAEADARYRASARQDTLPGEIEDPYYYAGPLEPSAFAPGRGVRSSVPQRVSSERRIAETYYRSKGQLEQSSGRDSDAVYGLFSSGNRPRGASGSHSAYASGSRSAYSEAPPASEVRRLPERPFAEARPETPEDQRERNRPDELARLHGDHAPRYDEAENDAYYDGVPVPRERSSDPAALNSAPSNVYLPPRPQQAPAPYLRPREDSSARQPEGTRNQAPPDERAAPVRMSRDRDDAAGRSGAPSEDPLPGSPRVLDQSRARRGESTAEMQARTARRPRESGALSRDDAPGESGERSASTPAASFEGGPVARGLAPVRYQDDVSPRSLPRVEETYFAAAGQDAFRDSRHDSNGKPEWLAREASSSPRSEAGEHRRNEPAALQNAAAAASAFDTEQRSNTVRYNDRRGRPGDSQMIPAADGGFNLLPLQDRATASVKDDRPAPAVRERSAYRGDNSRRPAAVRAEDRDVRRDPPPGVLTSGPADLPPLRPAAERRRAERKSAEHLVSQAIIPPPESSVFHAEPRVRRTAERSETPTADMRSIAPRAAETLQQSRERVAARWFALKGLMGSSGDTSAELAAARTPAHEVPVPILAVVSLSGGVGKTSLVATLGRALSAAGERTLLADATPHGLLPYYFGARELRPDVVRTFSPPPGSRDATVFMVNYEAERRNGDEAGQTALIEEMGRHVKGAQRLVLDLNGTSAWLARGLASMNTTILVPVAADMNSVLGIKNVERYLAGLRDAEGHPQLPFYILNQFDASLPLHLDVREVLRQQLGDRLLPVMIRRSPSVSEALAEGMTVLDYAPEAPVTEDYLQLAEWVRQRSAPAQTALRTTRWSER